MNRLSLLINTQYLQQGQSSKYIGDTNHAPLVRIAYRLAGKIKLERSQLLDPIWQSNNYQILRIARKLITTGL